MFLFYLIAALWLGWLGYWIAASTQVKPVARSESWQSRVAYSVPLWISAFLLLDRHFGHVLNRHLFPSMPWTLLLGTALTAAGIAFAVWARVVLGANWSAEVTVKEGHELSKPGPTPSRDTRFTRAWRSPSSVPLSLSASGARSSH